MSDSMVNNMNSNPNAGVKTPLLFCHLCGWGGQGQWILGRMATMMQFPEDIRSFKFPVDEVERGFSPGVGGDFDPMQGHSSHLQGRQITVCYPDPENGGFLVCQTCADGGNQPCCGLFGSTPPEERLRQMMQERTDPNTPYYKRKLVRKQNTEKVDTNTEK